jgi:penicillin-insensitive murein endopeptidase
VGPLFALPAAFWALAQSPELGRAADAGTAGDAPGDAALAGVPDLYRQRAQAFSRFRSPVGGAGQVVGGTSNGCLLGAARLPASGPGFEVLHLGRHRYYGHPDLVAFVRRLGLQARRKKLGPLLIGDLSQPRGGPTPSGHRSHQSGLDVTSASPGRPSWPSAS